MSRHRDFVVPGGIDDGRDERWALTGGRRIEVEKVRDALRDLRIQPEHRIQPLRHTEYRRPFGSIARPLDPSQGEKL
jgi:hypothetical protein